MNIYEIRDELCILAEPLEFITNTLDEIAELSKNLESEIGNTSGKGSKVISKLLISEINLKYKLASYLVLRMIEDSNELLDRISKIELDEFKEGNL